MRGLSRLRTARVSSSVFAEASAAPELLQLLTFSPLEFSSASVNLCKHAPSP
jgi:hypothetical protein